MSTKSVCDLCGEVIRGREVPKFHGRHHEVRAECPPEDPLAAKKVMGATVQIQFAESVEDVCFSCFRKVTASLVLLDPKYEPTEEKHE